MKKLTSLLLGVVLLLSLGISAFAEVPTDGVTGGGTFLNVPNYQPDLYVSKVVKCEDPNVEIPDETFEFTIEVNGAPYAFQTYDILDAAGNVIPVPENESSPTTDQYGTFSLKANQTAKFTYVGRVPYVVKEVSEISGFTPVEPASAEYAGTVSKKGTSLTFTNAYVPKLPDPTYGKLKVQKSISWPNGYKYAVNDTDPTEEFSFVLKIGNAVAVDEPYDIVDLSNLEVVASDVTDANGVFTIPAGFRAEFNFLPPESDYEVTEVAKDGWHEVSEREHVGSTDDGNTEYFSNTNTAFVVKKAVLGADEPTTQDFTFQLFDSGMSLLSGAKYWLYTTGGERVKEADGSYHEYETLSDGTFTLKQNQAAVFIGMAPGTVYSVKEVPVKGFEQVTPVSVDEFTGKTVLLSGAEILSFENQVVDLQGMLTVTKHLEYEKDAPLDNPSFSFVIEKKDKTSGIYNPIQATYHLSGTTVNLETTDEGVFTLKAGEMAMFDRLTTGDYKISEVTTGMNVGYAVKPGTDSEILVPLTTDGAEVDFYNTYTAKKLKINFLKCYHAGDETVKPLKGAKFNLFTDIDCTASFETVDEGNGTMIPVVYESDDDGNFSIENLREGTYYLKEIEAPEHFRVIPGIAVLKIKRVMVNGEETFTITTEAHLGSVDVLASEVTADDEGAEGSIVISDDEERIYSLPSAGGMGSLPFIIIGAVLMLAVALLFGFAHRKESK